MLGLSDLYWHGSPALHWLPFCLCVCVYVRVCVLWTWPRSEWMMLGSKPRNSGLWNFHNPDFYFFFFFGAPTSETVGLLILDARLHRALTHIHTHRQAWVKTKMLTRALTRNLQTYSRRRGTYDCRQIFGCIQTLMEHCVQLPTLWWHCYDHAGMI